MSRLSAFIEAVGQALCEKGRRALTAQVPFGDVLPDVARVALGYLQKHLVSDDIRVALGEVAAANALSDVYAMGGEALLVMNIGGLPDTLPREMISEIFLGADEVVRAAGAVTAGGHTVVDAEPKFGLVVTGTVHPDRILTKAGAQPGDRLFLTKPLGSGAITTAMKRQAASPETAQAAVESMLQLNRQASELARAVGINACTDITGFGLLGHGLEVATKSGVRLEIDGSRVPLLPGAWTTASSAAPISSLIRAAINRTYDLGE